MTHEKVLLYIRIYCNFQFNTALLIEDNSDWEISEEYVAILKLIGNGNFGEVQLAVVPHDIPNSKVQNYFKRSERSNPTGSSNLVVVKRLKGIYT